MKLAALRTSLAFMRQAMLFEATAKVFKTHKDVQSEFSRLMRDDPRYDIEHRAFLGQTYNLKAIADYETGPGAKVTEAKAAKALESAKSFVAHIARLLDGKTACTGLRPCPPP